MPVPLLPEPSMPEPSMPEFDPPPPITLITAPPGTGKTHAVLHALAEHGTRAVFAAPTHDLATQIHQDLIALGVKAHYWRQGPDENDGCPQRDMVSLFRDLGYLIRWGPCMDCLKNKRCSYRPGADRDDLAPASTRFLGTQGGQGSAPGHP